MITAEQRAAQAEAACFRLQCKIRFLVDDVRAFIAAEQRHGVRNDRLGALAQSAGIAESVLREDEPWRAVLMQIQLLEERIEEQRR